MTVSAASAQIEFNFQRLHEGAEAERIFAAEEYAEAQAAFDALAESSRDSVEASMWQARAAIALAHQDGQPEAAMERAKEIAHHPYAVYAQMKLLAMEPGLEAVVEEFGEEPIADWTPDKLPRRPREPEEEARVYALELRGRAFLRAEEPEKAERDFAVAAELVDGDRFKIDILHRLAAVRSDLGDEQGAFEAHYAISEIPGGFAARLRGVMAAANYLRRTGEPQAAFDLVREEIDPQGRYPRGTGHWYVSAMTLMGQALVDLGRYDEAAALFQEIMERAGEDTGVYAGAGLLLGDALTQGGHQNAAAEVYGALLEKEDLGDAERTQAAEALSAFSEQHGNGGNEADKSTDEE